MFKKKKKKKKKKREINSERDKLSRNQLRAMGCHTVTFNLNSSGLDSIGGVGRRESRWQELGRPALA
jgi:hypothetical protein